MLQSQDNSRRVSEVISSSDSPIRQSHKALKQPNQTSGSLGLQRINSNMVEETAQLGEERPQLNSAVINVNVSPIGKNSAHEKSLKQLLLDSLLQSLGNFGVIYYFVLLGVNYQNWDSFVSIYIFIQCALHILVSFVDLMSNKLRIYRRFAEINRQSVLIYEGSSRTFKQSLWHQLEPLQIIKLERGQACPANGIILGTMGMQDSVNLVDQTGGQLFKKACLVNIDLNNVDVEGIVNYEDKFISMKSKVNIRMNSQEHCLELSTQNKIKKNQINMSLSEIFVILSNHLKATTKVYQKVQIDPKFRNTITLQQIIIIFLVLLISIVLSVLYKFQYTPAYLNTGEVQSMPTTLLQYMVALSWMIPIYSTTSIFIMNRLSTWKTEQDRMLDPDLSGKRVSINNSCALPRMAKSRYILTDLGSLSRPTKNTIQVFINRMSDEVNLQNPFQIVPLQAVEDQGLGIKEISYALLTLDFNQKSDDDIAIQKALLNYGLIIGQSGQTRILQQPDLIQSKYKLLMSHQDKKYTLMCYEQEYFKKQKRYFYLYRSTFNDCSQFMDPTIELQLKEQVEDVKNIIIIFKKATSLQNIMKLVKSYKTTKEISEETLITIRHELEPTAFIDLEESQYDAHMELLDLLRSDYKVWINTYINNLSILEDDFTLSNLIKYCQVEKINCPNAQELSEKIYQIKLQCTLKGVNKSQKYFMNDKPLFVYLDETSFSIGMKNQLISEEFSQFIYQVPFVVLLNFKASTLKLITIPPSQIISATSYTTLEGSISIRYNDSPTDVKVPHFSFVPKLLIHHSKLSLMKLRQVIVFANYTSLLIGLVQVIYSGINRFSSQGLLTERTYLILSLSSFLYGVVFISFMQDFPYHIFARYSNFELITRISFNPYIKLGKDFLMSSLHAACIVAFTYKIFYGTNDANGYVHGLSYQQMIIVIYLIVVIAFKVIFELYRVALLQLFISAIYIASAYTIVAETDSDLGSVFDQGLKTKELVSIVFVPIIILSPSLCYVYIQRVVRKNEVNTMFYRMQAQQDEENDQQKLKEAKNYIKKLDIENENDETEQIPSIDETKKQIV